MSNQRGSIKDFEADNSTTFRCKSEDDQFHAIIGGDRVDKFTPDLRLNCFGGEDTFQFRLPVIGNLDKVATDKISWLSNDRKIGLEVYAIENLENWATNEKGQPVLIDTIKESMEFDVIFYDKPARVGLDAYYKLSFQVDIPSDIRIIKQKALHKDHSTWHEDKYGICIRPDNVVGGHVFKHKNKRGNKYKTGQLCIEYCPYVVDAIGKKEKLYVEYDIVNGYKYVYISWDFLNNAVYPIHHCAGDTFGYTTAGGSLKVMANRYDGNLDFYSPSNNGTVTSMEAYCKNVITSAFVCGIYNWTGANHPFLAGSAEGTAPAGTPAWVEVSISGSPSIYSANEYLLCYWGDYNHIYYNDTNVGGNIVSEEDTYGNSWKATGDLLTTIAGDNEYSVFVNYTPSATRRIFRSNFGI